MEVKLGRTIPFVKLEVKIFKSGTQAEIGINQGVMEELSSDAQDKVINELQKAHQNITRILEKQG